MKPCGIIVSVIVAVFGVILPIAISFFLGGRVSRYVSPPYDFHDMPDLTGKVAVITGSNTGIGYVSAREMARKGATVIVAARSKEKGEDAVQRIRAEIGNTPGASLVEFVQLDLSSLAQVKTFADDFNSRGIPLDMLILNAGVMAPEFGLTSDGFETQIGTNHMGHFLLVKLLTPVIKSSKARVVHVSSAAHMFSYPEGIRLDSFRSDFEYDPLLAYGQSKLANILFSNELAKQLNGTGATSNSLHPGLIKTELSRHLEKSAHKTPYAKILLTPFAKLFEMVQLNVDGGALTQLYVATAPRLEEVTGAYFVPIAINSDISAQAKNATLQKLLWDESERAIKDFL